MRRRRNGWEYANGSADTQESCEEQELRNGGGSSCLLRQNASKESMRAGHEYGKSANTKV